MLKRKYIKRMYIEIPYCDKCGAEMRHTGSVLLSDPAKYVYKCTNKNCNERKNFWEYDLPNQLKYEFEEAECDV